MQIPQCQWLKRISLWRPHFLRSICLLGSLLLGTTSFAAQTYTTTVGLFQFVSTQNCLFFTLTGVTQADPINPGSAWFSIPGTQTGYSQVYALLLSAKVSGKSVNVITTGAAAPGACGPYAAVSVVTLQ